MHLLLIALGGMLGAWLFAVFANGDGVGGFMIGALGGFLLARLQKFRDRLIAVERELAALRLRDASAGVAKFRDAEARPSSPIAPAPAATSAAAEPAVAAATESPELAETPYSAPIETPVTNVAAAPEPVAVKVSAAAARGQDHWRQDWDSAKPAETAAPMSPPRSNQSEWFERAKRWFTEGNVPVKVGVLVLIAGVGALLKYFADQGWLKLPVELKLAAVAAAAIAALGLGWRERLRRREFALSLQGGAIGVLIAVVFVAYQVFHLLSPAATFAMLLLLVAATAVLAILQNAMALAIFGIISGFAAPIIASSGSGNHVVLFSYYALLNFGILAVAWKRGWRALNLLGFVFTFVIGTAWGVLKYEPGKFASTEPFLIGFFLLYVAIGLLYALRQPDGRRGLVDGSLTFGTPLVAFALQALLLQDDDMALAQSAVAVGVFYVSLAAWLTRRGGLGLLRDSYLGLAICFVTIAVPLALSAHWTVATWALEGAALVWLGIAQNRRLSRWAGLLLQLAAGISFIDTPPHFAEDRPLLDGYFLSCLIICLAGFYSGLKYSRKGAADLLYGGLFLWSWAWWLVAWVGEIDTHLPSEHLTDALLVLTALGAAIGALLRLRCNWSPCLLPVLAALFLALPFTAWTALAHHAPLLDYGVWAWAFFAVATLLALRLSRDGPASILSVAHAFWLLAWPALAVLQLHDVAARQLELGDGWIWAMTSAPVLVFLWVLWRDQRWLYAPLRGAAAANRTALLGVAASIAALSATLACVAPGDATPLRFLPGLNPLEIFQVAALLLLYACYRSARGVDRDRDRSLLTLLMGLAFLIVTAATLRGVYQFGYADWDPNIFNSRIAQTALTIVWTLLGVSAWVIGSRRGLWSVWLIGAVLMVVVLGKLLLIDRQHWGDLPGIVSFLVVGFLLVGVGYFAPQPPRGGPSEAAP